MHLRLCTDEDLRAIKKHAASSYTQFATNLMRHLYSKEERLKDVNMRGHKKGAISPDGKRLNYILSCMFRQYGIPQEQYRNAKKAAVKAMDDANRAFRNSQQVQQWKRLARQRAMQE